MYNWLIQLDILKHAELVINCDTLKKVANNQVAELDKNNLYFPLHSILMVLLY